MHCQANWLDRTIDENMIHTEHWKTRRVGANGFFRLDEFAHVAQMAVQGSEPNELLKSPSKITGMLVTVAASHSALLNSCA